MLVLTRKKKEVIHIGHEIRVVVDAIEKGRVRLGVIAPREVIVHRGEVYAEAFPDGAPASPIHEARLADLRKAAERGYNALLSNEELKALLATLSDGAKGEK